MQNLKFFNDLFNFYLEIKFPEIYKELSIIDKNIVWYYADKIKNLVCSSKQKEKKIIEIDISSAFPTICDNLYKNSDFSEKIKTLKSKLEKNIFIATSLKGPNLKRLNNICKMIILGLIFDSTDINELNDITIFELNKDGCILSCNDFTIERLKNIDGNTKFTNFLLNNNFKFHKDLIDLYIRDNRTSFIYNNNTLKIKGIYKYYPMYLKSLLEDFLLNKIEKEKFISLYNNKKLRIIQKFSLYNLLEKLYICENNKIINNIGKYEKFKASSNINPKIYLKIFVYPIIISQVF